MNYKINSDLENSSENNYEVGHPQKDHSIRNPIPVVAQVSEPVPIVVPVSEPAPVVAPVSEPAPIVAPVSGSILTSAPARNLSAFIPTFNPTPI